jgi:hypothetical protein
MSSRSAAGAVVLLASVQHLDDVVGLALGFAPFWVCCSILAGKGLKLGAQHLNFLLPIPQLQRQPVREAATTGTAGIVDKLTSLNLTRNHAADSPHMSALMMAIAVNLWQTIPTAATAAALEAVMGSPTVRTTST